MEGGSNKTWRSERLEKQKKSENLEPGKLGDRGWKSLRTWHQLQLTCAHKGCCQKPIVSDKQSLQILCTAEIGQRKS